MPTLTMTTRSLSPGICVIDISGEVTHAAENVLMDAYTEATGKGAEAILLNFAKLEYMNSSGIGLLVTLLIRAQRKGQRLMAYGLTDHYRQIFALTRLDDAIGIYDTEEDCVTAFTTA